MQKLYFTMFYVACKKGGNALLFSGIQNLNTLHQTTSQFQEILTKLRWLRLDHHEFACLRAIILFKTGENLLK